MANWKKIVVSGSSPEFFHVTSSGNISSSGKLYGGLDQNTDQINVVVYNPATGELEYKELNLISTVAAPRLFLADQVNSDSTVADFRLSYDTGSSAVGGGVVPYTRLSASAENPGTYDVLPSNNLSWKGINDQWVAEVDNDGQSNTIFYEGSINKINSVSGSRNGLIKGESAQTPITISLNAIDNDGDANSAVPSYNSANPHYNYLAKSFNDGGIGELRIYANTNVYDTPTRTIDLTNYDSITGAASGITIDLSPTRSNQDGNTGAEDTTKHARSGSYVVGTSLQNDGYNYTYALHTGSKDGTDFAYITNFVEWFYDEAGAAADLSITEQPSQITAGVFDTEATKSISGIKFYNVDAGNNTYFTYGVKCVNQYKNIFPTRNDAIVFDVLSNSNNVIQEVQITQSGQYTDTSHINAEQVDASISNGALNFFPLAHLQNTANAATNDTRVTASIKVDFPSEIFHQPSDYITTPWGDSSNEADASFRFIFKHITTDGSHKDIDDVTSNTITLDDYMVNTIPERSNEHEMEAFVRETYRIQSGTYANTTDLSGTAVEWDGEENVDSGTNGHNKGMVQYESYLVYPTKCGDSGIFNPSLGPSNFYQPNYSVANGEREYLRYFKLISGQEGSKRLNFSFVGSGKIVSSSHTTDYGAGNNDAFKMFVWRDNGGAASLFGQGEWVDVFNPNMWNPVNNGITNDETQYIELSTTPGGINFSQTNLLDGTNYRTSVIKIQESADASANAFSVGDIVGVRLVFPDDWEGYLHAMDFQTGNPTSTLIGGGSYTNY